MTEHGFIRSIHALLKRRLAGVYIWKINDQYQGGVADAYYSYSKDTWVEYKYKKSLPKRSTTQLDLGLSALQKDWLRSRHAEGRNVAVIAGFGDRAIILPGTSWERAITVADFNISCVDRDGVVDYLIKQLVN